MNIEEEYVLEMKQNEQLENQFEKKDEDKEVNVLIQKQETQDINLNNNEQNKNQEQIVLNNEIQIEDSTEQDLEKEQQQDKKSNNEQEEQKEKRQDDEEEEEINNATPVTQEQKNQIEQIEVTKAEQSEKVQEINQPKDDKQQQINNEQSKSKSQKKKSPQIAFNQEKFQMMKKQLFTQQKRQNVFDVRKQHQHTNIFDQAPQEQQHSIGRTCHEACKRTGKKSVEVQDLEEIQNYSKKLKEKRKKSQAKEESVQQEQKRARIQRPCKMHQKTQDEKDQELMEQIQKEKKKATKKRVRSQQKQDHALTTSKKQQQQQQKDEEQYHPAENERSTIINKFNVKNEKKKLDNMILKLTETSPSKNYKYTRQSNNETEQFYSKTERHANSNKFKNFENTYPAKQKMGYSEIKAERDKLKPNKQQNQSINNTPVTKQNGFGYSTPPEDHVQDSKKEQQKDQVVTNYNKVVVGNDQKGNLNFQTGFYKFLLINNQLGQECMMAHLI